MLGTPLGVPWNPMDVVGMPWYAMVGTMAMPWHAHEKVK